MYEIIKTLFSDGEHTYSTLITIIAILFIFYSMYNKIKYLCLEKAAEKVAEVEKMSELSGQEKFALVVLWINNDLPKIFKNELTKIIIERLVQFVYANSSAYAKNYIKRKTGYDISGLIENLSNTSQDNSIATITDESTDNK